MTAVYLRIEKLTKLFGDFAALRDVDLDVNEGEFLCFLGPSGCGKTTLLRAIAGLDIQTYGTIVQGGRDVSALPPEKRDFGIVFQSYALFPNLTVTQNIAYGLENQKVKKDEIRARVEELLRLVGLEEHAHKYPSQISGGQQQRVALARAVATSPALLLLDEPLSALDARVRRRLRQEIRDFHRRLGITTIMVTHDQEEALTMADRIVVMNHGCVEQVGTPQEIYSNPATAFVADFIGTMNFIDAEVVSNGQSGDGVTVRLGERHLHAKGRLNGERRVRLAIRPEDIVARDIAVDAENRIEAEVVAMEFLGSFFRVTLAGGDVDGSRLDADFSPNFVRDHDLKTGASIAVRLPKERIHLYSVDEETAPVEEASHV